MECPTGRILSALVTVGSKDNVCRSPEVGVGGKSPLDGWGNVRSCSKIRNVRFLQSVYHMLHLAAAVQLFAWAIHGLAPHSNAVTSRAKTYTTTSSTSTSPTILYGGYDATIGADPNTPIQIYCSKEKTPADLCTFLCLAELDLKYEVMSELPRNPVPDWFLRIHPDGTTPALRNPVDESLNNEIVANSESETDKVNQYLCKVYQATKSSVCPLFPTNDESMKTMKSIQRQIDETILPACIAFLENEDPTHEVDYQAAAEDDLRSLFFSATTSQTGTSSTTRPFLLGSDLTLVDIYLFVHLKFVFLELNQSKKYTLPSSTMGNMKSWHDACASRPAFQKVLSSSSKKE